MCSSQIRIGCLRMKNNTTTQKQLEKQYNKLVKERQRLEKNQRQTEYKLWKREAEFKQVEKHILTNIIHPGNIKSVIRTTGAYLLGRRNRKQLYSKTYKQKQAANDIKKYTTALYEKGFTKKALTDL